MGPPEAMVSSELEDIEELHQKACAAGESTYIDPKTGYSVFTALSLGKRPCCGNICRHCPYRDRDGEKATVANASIEFLNGNMDDISLEIDLLFWSGGKDSYLAYLHLQKESERERELVLLTTYNEANSIVAHQEIHIGVIKKQASALGNTSLAIPLDGKVEYTLAIGNALKKLENNGIDIHRIVFGDLHLDHIRTWRDSSLDPLGNLYYPLWKIPYDELLKQLENSNVVARISAVDVDSPARNFINVGDVFNTELIKRLPDHVDKFGENGEFHSVVEVWNDQR